MKIKHYIWLMATALLAGCAFDDPKEKDWSAPLFHSDSEIVPVTFTMSSQHNVDLTRAATSIITFDQGELVKVLVKPDGETSYLGYDYTTAAAAQSVGLDPVSAQPYFPAGVNSTVEAYAYYPATALSTEMFTVASDQTSDAAYKTSDLMFAPNRTITKDVDDGKNHLKMEHQMAQLRISANPATGTTINITEIQVVAKKSLTFTPEGVVASTTTGDPGTITARFGAGEAYVLIPPQIISDVLIKIVTGGGTDSEIATYGFTAEGSFQAGNSYGVDISVTADQLGMTTAISNWNGMGNVVIAPSGDLVITPIPAQRFRGGEAIEPPLEVKKNGVLLVKDVDYEVVYLNNKNAGTAYVVVTGKVGTNFEGCVGVTPFSITEAEASILYDGHAASIEDKIYCDEPFIKELTNSGDGMVTYTSSDETVATVDPATGQVTLLKPGVTTITASVTDGANYTYPVKTASYGLTVYKRTIDNFSFATANPERTWSATAAENSYSQTVTQASTVVSSIISSTLSPVEYTIIGNTNTCGATIDGSTVSFTKAGSVQILATVEDNDYYNYNTKTASYTLTVNPHTGSVTLSAQAGTVNFGSTGEFTVTGHHDGGAITVASGDETVATVSYSDPKVTITTVGAGSTKITVTCAATDCYAEAKAEYDLVVGIVTAGVTPPNVNNLTYTGDPQALLTAGSAEGGTMKYRYKLSGGEWSAWSESVPMATNAGTYLLEYMVEGDANHSDLAATPLNNAVIAKATPTGVWSSNEATVECGKTLTRTFTITGVKGETFATTYHSNNEYMATVSASGVVTGVNVGSATITASSAESDNYKALSADYIMFVTIGTPNVSAPVANNRTYDGTEQPLVSAGSTSGGTLEYSTNNSTWGNTIPTATNAGDYTVYYRVVGNSNYGTVPSTPVAVTISPRVVSSPIIVLATNSFTYNGNAQTPAVSAVRDGQTTIPTSEYTVSYSDNINATSEAKVHITDKAGGNYTVSGINTFTINKATGYVTISANYGDMIKGNSRTFTVDSHHPGGDLTVSSSNTEHATASLSGSTVTVTGKATNSSPTITVRCAETENYTANEAKYIAYVAPTMDGITSSHIGWTISAAGYIFASGARCKAAGQTPRAMVAYVGTRGNIDPSSTARGLALALTDCGGRLAFCVPGTAVCGLNTYAPASYTDAQLAAIKNGIANTNIYLNKIPSGHTHPGASAIKTWIKNNPAPSGTSGWFLPAIGQQLLMTGVGSLIVNAGGTALDHFYWSASEYGNGSGVRHCGRYTGKSGTSKNRTEGQGNFRLCFGF